jgi:patatin-like phospholipase/acyl hydrolase
MSFRILSLSGGGVRGIYQAVYLDKLMTRRPQPLSDYFDLIAGTSTGAIICPWRSPEYRTIHHR